MHLKSQKRYQVWSFKGFVHEGAEVKAPTKNSDNVDDMLFGILKELNLEGSYNKQIKKLTEGIYQVGSKKLNMKILSGDHSQRISDAFKVF